MTFRLDNTTIRLRLHALLVTGTVTVAAILALGVYLLMSYRINGPVYEEIQRLRDVESAIQPPVMYEVYILLREMRSLTRQDEIREGKARFDRLVIQYGEARDTWLSSLPPEGEASRAEGDRHKAAAEIISIARADYLPRIGQRGDRDSLGELLSRTIAPNFRNLRQASDEMLAALQEENRKVESRAAARIHFWMRGMIVLSVTLVLLGGLVGWFTIRGIVETTGLLLRRVTELASGASDLTARIPVESDDEMGRLAAGINAMIEKIQSIVAKVRQSSLQLLSTASEISATARQQDATVQGLSSSTTEVAAAVREISATSKELAGTMSEVNDRANAAAKLAASGKKRLGGMESTMEGLVESTTSISGKLATIRDKANTINMVVTTITKVADQTNLLSINAAIEAEKAGEYGRGFLVVAREIRRLADQTAVATLDIDSMVRHMQEAVTSGVMQMDKFSEEVRAGMRRVAEINGQTGQIIEEVHGLSERYHQVNEGMRNQAIGAEQINEAMGNMTANIRQTAAALEEFNRATAHMRGSVEVLNQEVAKFRI
jgi:methyl-accepting chemotaxis protein WspA